MLEYKERRYEIKLRSMTDIPPPALPNHISVPISPLAHTNPRHQSLAQYIPLNHLFLEPANGQSE